MSNFFLNNSSINSKTYSEFKAGMLELISINRQPTHIFYKHESLYSLSVLVDFLYTAEVGQVEQEIYRYLEQLSPNENLIETEAEANAFCNSNMNGFLGINFADSGIVLNKQITDSLKYKNWCFEFMSNFDFYLSKSELSPQEKKIHLSDHHGKKELGLFCDRIKNSPYVIEMQSTNWGGKSFIRKINSNGIIEIVLYWTDKQYAINVKTTGSDIIETNAIAKILSEKYNN